MFFKKPILLGSINELRKWCALIAFYFPVVLEFLRFIVITFIVILLFYSYSKDVAIFELLERTILYSILAALIIILFVALPIDIIRFIKLPRKAKSDKLSLTESTKVIKQEMDEDGK